MNIDIREEMKENDGKEMMSCSSSPVKIRKSLMCPNCFRIKDVIISTYCHVKLENYNHAEGGLIIEDLDITPQFDSFHVISGYCNNCGSYIKDFAQIDYSISDIIRSLNLAGYITKFCCEGHIIPDGSISMPYIVFYGEYSEEDLNLPDSWKIDHQFNEGNPYPDIVTRIEPANKERMQFDFVWNELNQWLLEKKTNT